MAAERIWKAIQNLGAVEQKPAAEASAPVVTDVAPAEPEPTIVPQANPEVAVAAEVDGQAAMVAVDTAAKPAPKKKAAKASEKADAPKAFHYGGNPRVPPIVCTAEVGWYITTHERIASIKDFNLGSHGYDPASPYMAALFVAEGPAFRQGVTLAPFDNVDVEPLMAKLLGLKAPKADGMAATFRPVLTVH